MRAKFKVTSVVSEAKSETWPHEKVEFSAVTESPFDADGVSEDNGFAKWTPSANLSMVITNPALFGTLVLGEKYYVDFTKAEG